MAWPTPQRLWGKETTIPPESPPARPHGDIIKSLLPRTEILVLLVGLTCTIWGKLAVIRSYKPQSLLPEMVVILPDLLFFAAVALLIRLLYIIRPSAFAARCALLIAAAATVWSILNTGWLITSGVQLQPGILLLVVSDFRDLMPLALSHLLNRLEKIIILVVVGLAICAFLVGAMLRPGRVIPVRNHHLRWSLALILAITAVLLARPACPASDNLSITRETLGFSSHWYAMLSMITLRSQNDYPLQHSANIYLAGQRRIGLPPAAPNQLPNVALVLLEGVSYSATSLSPTGPSTTPFLARLAQEGVEFRTTRIPVPYTSKAFWVTLTGTTPVIDNDNAEAVPVEIPYEGLPSALAKLGYHSAFFEMSKGSFECAAGFFSNLGFDWAWFRENLQDPSAHIGYLGGDDCRIIEPALKWVKQNGRPFFLMIITSVAHDPYFVPEWFEKPADDLYERYLQTVRYTDHFLERFYNELRANGFAENTLLCVLGDHGTSFRTDKAKGRWVPYEEVIRIPWVIHWPGHLSPRSVVEWSCSQLDVTPTILKLVGFDIADADFEGMDAIQEPNSPRRFYFSSLMPDSPVGFVEQSRKVVYWPYIGKTFEYDLRSDPNEENPLIIPSGRIEQLRKDILAWQDRSQIAANAKKHTRRFLYSHWQVFSAGRSAWAYYVP